MKILSGFLLAAALVAPATVSAANFEGKVRMKITTGKTAQDLDYSVKGGLARIDMQTRTPPSPPSSIPRGRRSPS